MYTPTLSIEQKRKLIEDFQSDDEDRRKDALAVFIEFDMTIHDVAEMTLLGEA